MNNDGTYKHLLTKEQYQQKGKRNNQNTHTAQLLEVSKQ